MPLIETRAVLAAAYKGKALEARPLLTHAYNVSEDRTLCRGVKSDSISDSEAMDVTAKPTCAKCLARDPRFK